MDQKLLFLINREWTSPALDRLMAIMSSAAFWAIPLAIIAASSCWWGGFRARTFVILALLTFALTDGVVGRTLKKTVGRARPSQSEVGIRTIDLASPAWRGVFAPVKEKLSTGDERGKRGGSFPSNHAANTAGIALLATLLWRRWGWLALLPSMCVAYSRVYVGSHWPTDVIAGILIGFATALLVLTLAEWAWRRWGQRLAPRIAAQHPSLLMASPA
jgi:membrane-associated phospholipid phosphatase